MVTLTNDVVRNDADEAAAMYKALNELDLHGADYVATVRVGRQVVCWPMKTDLQKQSNISGRGIPRVMDALSSRGDH